MGQKLITRQVAILLQVTQDTVQRYIRLKELPATETSIGYLVDMEDLIHFLIRHRARWPRPSVEAIEIQNIFVALFRQTVETLDGETIKELAEMAMTILLTKFDESRHLAWKGARAKVLECIGVCRGNESFTLLVLVKDLFYGLDESYQQRKKVA